VQQTRGAVDQPAGYAGGTRPVRRPLLSPVSPALEPGPTRERLIAALAELEHKDASSVAAEVFAERSKFEKQWKRERPSVSATFFTLLGPPLQPGFDLMDLATGGRDLLVEPAVIEPEPLE